MYQLALGTSCTIQARALDLVPRPSASASPSRASEAGVLVSEPCGPCRPLSTSHSPFPMLGSQGARKCTYERWFRKLSWAGASPLTLPLAHAAMQRFLRFRTGCHDLPKDIGSQFGVLRHQRVCQLCGTGFGDEMHLVFECAAMQICVANFQIFFSHVRRCSNSCGSQICCRLPNS